MTMTFGIRQAELPWGNAGKNTRADITRIATEVAALGANSISTDCLWIQLDPWRNRHYKWADLDYVIDAIEGAGLDILLNIEPRRSMLPIGVAATSDVASDYGKFCGDIAARYADRPIRWFEIGNEVNNLAYFGAPKEPSKYLRFLRAAYTAIKEHMPQAAVLAGALQAVGTGWPSMAPVEWTQKLYEASPQEFFDGLSMHPYMRDDAFTTQVPTPDNFSFKNIEGIRAIMDANGDAAKLIYTTEWGYESMTSPSGLSDTDVEREAEQAANVAAQWNLLAAYADSGVIYPITWPFMYRDWEQANKKSQNHYGMVHFDFTRKPEWSFFRGLTVNRDLAPDPAPAAAVAWAPDIAVFIDPNNLRPPRAELGAQAWAPTVVVPVAPPPAGAAAQAYEPLIDSQAPRVEYVSVGAGARDTSSDADVTISWTHAVADLAGRMLIVGLVVSTNTNKPWSLYNTLSVSSDLGGAFIRLGSRHIADTTFGQLGSVHLFGMYHPRVGTHTISARVRETDFITTFASVAANSVLYKGVSGPGALASAGSSSGGNTPSVKVASVIDDRAIAVIGAAQNPATTFNQTSRYAAGSSVTGDGDFIVIGDASGAAAVTFSSPGSQYRYGALALDIVRIIPPQRALYVPAAAASAAAWTPTVITNRTAVAPAATATAQALAPALGLRVNPPLPTAMAQALTPTVGVPSTAVMFDAVGGGARDNDGRVSWSHVVGSGAHRYLIVGLCVSQNAISDFDDWDTFTVTSDLDGALTRLKGENVGTQFRGGVHLFGRADPTAGTHTISVHVADPVADVDTLMGQSVSYTAVGGVSGATSQTNFSAALNMSVTSGADNRVVFCGGWSANPTNVSGGTERYRNGGSVIGSGDFMILSDAPGAATVKLTASSGPQSGAVGVSLNHA
jgi:hypothetical protein